MRYRPNRRRRARWPFVVIGFAVAGCLASLAFSYAYETDERVSYRVDEFQVQLYRLFNAQGDTLPTPVLAVGGPVTTQPFVPVVEEGTVTPVIVPLTPTPTPEGPTATPLATSTPTLPPTPAVALANRLSMPPKKVAALLVRLEEPIPLDEPGADGITPADWLVDESAKDPAVAAETKELTAALGEVLAQLEPKAAEIMTLRFGLDDGEPRTLEETGEIFGLTRERIRQIESKSLKKLRHPIRSDQLRDFLDGLPPTRKEPYQDDAGIDEGQKAGARPDEATSIGASACGEVKPVKTMVNRRSEERNRPVQNATDRAIAMAREIGVEVEDGRKHGGDVLIRLNRTDDAKQRQAGAHPC